MNFFKRGWFSKRNELWPGICQSLEVEEVLQKSKSYVQSIYVLQTESYRRALVLDGIRQRTEKDEFSYQEMISFLPLCSHPDPRTVLVVGRGAGGVAREVVKFPTVEKVYQVEIDGDVVEESRRFLPFVARGFEDPTVELHIADGYEFVRRHSAAFDVIITDNCNPVGPTACLFEEPYFASMKKALKPGGIICSQVGTYWSNINQVKYRMNKLREMFPKVEYATSSMPSYPTGQMGYMLVSTDAATDFRQPRKVFSEAELDTMGMRYYSDKVHTASFQLPEFSQRSLSYATKGTGP